MKNNRTIQVASIALLAIVIVTDTALGRDLGSAANNAVSTAKIVARALSLFGLLAGGALMNIPGLAEFGKRTMGAGLIGCLCAFGGPTIITFFEGVFGGF